MGAAVVTRERAGLQVVGRVAPKALVSALHKPLEPTSQPGAAHIGSGSDKVPHCLVNSAYRRGAACIGGPNLVRGDPGRSTRQIQRQSPWGAAPSTMHAKKQGRPFRMPSNSHPNPSQSIQGHTPSMLAPPFLERAWLVVLLLQSHRRSGRHPQPKCAPSAALHQRDATQHAALRCCLLVVVVDGSRWRLAWLRCAAMWILGLAACNRCACAPWLIFMLYKQRVVPRQALVFGWKLFLSVVHLQLNVRESSFS